MGCQLTAQYRVALHGKPKGYRPHCLSCVVLTRYSCASGTMRGSFQMVELGKGNEPVRTFDAVVPSVVLQS